MRDSGRVSGGGLCVPPKDKYPYSVKGQATHVHRDCCGSSGTFWTSGMMSVLLFNRKSIFRHKLCEWHRSYRTMGATQRVKQCG